MIFVDAPFHAAVQLNAHNYGGKCWNALTEMPPPKVLRTLRGGRFVLCHYATRHEYTHAHLCVYYANDTSACARCGRRIIMATLGYTHVY